MGYVIAGLLMGLVAGAGAAHPRPLAPIDRDFAVFAPHRGMQGYHLAVREALLGGSGRRTFEALVIPSFEREWAVHLQESGGRSKVVCTIMREQLWARMQAAAEGPGGSIDSAGQLRALHEIPKHTWRFSAPISAGTAAALEELGAAMLIRVEQPAQPPLCLDGTTYYLFQWVSSAGSRGGWGLCPQWDTPAKAVLDLLGELRKTAGSSGQALAQRDWDLAVEARRIMAELK